MGFILVYDGWLGHLPSKYLIVLRGFIFLSWALALAWGSLLPACLHSKTIAFCGSMLGGSWVHYQTITLRRHGDPVFIFLVSRVLEDLLRLFASQPFSKYLAWESDNPSKTVPSICTPTFSSLWPCESSLPFCSSDVLKLIWKSVWSRLSSFSQWEGWLKLLIPVLFRSRSSAFVFFELL